MESVSVILPTYNERENLLLVLRGLQSTLVEPYEILVVDDDSPDGTWQVAEEIARRNNNVKVLRRLGRRGLVSALTEGIAMAPSETIVWMDCDLSMPPDLVPRLVETLKEADLAVGSRFVPGGADRREFWAARVASRGVCWLARVLLNSSVYDYTSGFIATRREVVERLGLRGVYGEYCIDLFYRALRADLTIREVPYIYVQRHAGTSKTATSIWGLLQQGPRYVGMIFRSRFS